MKLFTLDNVEPPEYFTTGAPEERDIPKTAGFIWNSDRKHWTTDDPQKAYAIINHPSVETTGTVRRRIEDAIDAARAELDKSRAKDADVDIPAPAGLEYMPFQRAGIAYAMRRDATLIADEMGLGKTIQALGVINAQKRPRSVLIICPASLRLNWQNEAKKWLIHPSIVSIIDSKRRHKPPFEKMDVCIINFDILHSKADFLRSRVWDLMIVDEAHYLKNPKARRTQHVLGSQSLEPIKATRRLFLTGTPIVNRPIEIQPILASMDAERYGNRFQFARRFCAATQISVRGRLIWDFSGASNLEELQKDLRSRVMVRRLKADVLSELPAKQRSVVEIPANGLSGEIEQERMAFERLNDAIADLRAAVELAKASDDPEAYKRAVENLRAGIRARFEEISALRRRTAIAKAPLVAAHAKEAIENGIKVVIFAHHHEVIDHIADALGIECVKLDGRDSMEKRDAAVRNFQERNDIRAFVGGIRAAGVGLTLTASSHVIFAELDWVPGNITQAEDRCHRIGQSDSVLVQHLVLEGSLDASMAKTLIDKQAVIDAALDDEIDETMHEPMIPTAAPVKPIQTRTAQLAREAEGLTPIEILEIHANLKYLAAMCDGASARDGMGFNKIDTYIGKSLAHSDHLTAKQAALGKKLCRKYRKQLERR